jgi:hypothetical protein
MIFQEKMIIQQDQTRLFLKLWNTEIVLKLSFDFLLKNFDCSIIFRCLKSIIIVYRII